jgi:hypothetical protein
VSFQRSARTPKQRLAAQLAVETDGCRGEETALAAPASSAKSAASCRRRPTARASFATLFHSSGRCPFATSHATTSGASYPRSTRKRSSALTSLRKIDPLPPSPFEPTKPKNRRRGDSASVSAFGFVPIAVLAKNKAYGVEAPGIEAD